MSKKKYVHYYDKEFIDCRYCGKVDGELFYYPHNLYGHVCVGCLYARLIEDIPMVIRYYLDENYEGFTEFLKDYYTMIEE